MPEYKFEYVHNIKGETKHVCSMPFENDVEAAGHSVLIAQLPEHHDTHVVRVSELSEHGIGMRSVCQTYSDVSTIRIMRSLTYKATAGEVGVR